VVVVAFELAFGFPPGLLSRCDQDVVVLNLPFLLLAFRSAEQLQTKIFDPIAQSTITAVRSASDGDLVVAGIANAPGLPLVKHFRAVSRVAGILRTRDGGHTWQTAVVRAWHRAWS
jgi:hypothetical protein